MKQKMLGSPMPLLGDCPNLEQPVKREDAFWKVRKEEKGWTLQVSLLTGHARIVDEYGFRKAWGDYESMQEKFRRLVRKEFLEPGDVIGVSRKRFLGIYDHYGVYCGNGQVIHYAGSGGDLSGTISIHRTTLSEFLKTDPDYFVLYFPKNGLLPVKIQSSTNFLLGNDSLVNAILLPGGKTISLFSPEETIERAKSKIGETAYNIVGNNCEHFAMWCKTGTAQSYQVDRAVENLTRSFLYDVI